MRHIKLICLMIVLGVSCSTDLNWYKMKLSSEVVPPYVATYKILRNEILDPLLQIDISDLKSSPDKVTVLAQKLSCGVDQMGDSITKSFNSSEVLRIMVDEKVIDLVNSVSLKETEVSGKQIEITSKNTEIAQVQERISSAEQAVQDKQNGVNRADNDVREAEEAVRKARERCITGRRRKRFLGFIKDIFKLPEKLVCQVVNTGGIDRAKDRRNMAQQQLASAIAQLSEYQKQLSSLQSEQTNLKNQLDQFNGQLQSLLNTLAQLRQEQTLITGISSELRQIVTYLATLMSSSTVLNEVLDQLIDFELLIVPLNGVYHALANSGFLEESQQITQSTITEIQTSLSQLTTVLPEIPLGTNDYSTLLYVFQTMWTAWICLTLIYLSFTSCNYMSLDIQYQYPLVPYDDIEIISLSRSSGQYQRAAINGVDSNAPMLNDFDIAEQATMDLPWEQFITSAPMTVNLLGQLMVVSSKLDFSFVDYSPNYQFIYLKHPKSFRATLVQISNDGYQAFLEAHTNMNKIQLYMQLIPGHIKTALKLLAESPTPRTLSTLLPRTLNEIQKIGKGCVTLSNQTHNTFLTVMNLLGEVIAVTEEARGLQETKLRETDIELNVSRVMQGELNKLGDTIKQHYDEARDAVRKAQDDYSKALRRIPTGFKGMLMDLGRAVIGMVSSFSQSVAMSGGQGGVIATSLLKSQSLAFGKLFGEALWKMASRVTSFLDNDNSQTTNPFEEFDAFKVTFETFLSSINSGKSSELNIKISNLIEEGVAIADEALGLAKETIGNGQEVSKQAADDLKNRMNTLLSKVKPLVAAEASNNAAVPPASNPAQSGDSSQNEKFIAQMTKDRLATSEQRYDAIFMQLKEQQQEMGKLMVKIAGLDMTRINYRQILELMREALLLLAKIREQWNQLVLFFAEISVRAEIAVDGTLEPFIELGTEAGATDLSQEERMFYVDLLKAQAVNIHKQSYQLFIMSNTYVDMSSNFLMKRLAGLSQMLTANDDTERMLLLNQLKDETKTAQDSVIELVNERKSNYTKAVAKRRTELDTFIQELGGPSKDDQKAIDDGKELLGLMPRHRSFIPRKLYHISKYQTL